MPATNYDESQVPAYTLPDPLTTIAGKKVTDAETWTSERRPELLSLFESEVYGKAPRPPRGTAFRGLERGPLHAGQHGHPPGDRRLFHRERRTFHDHPALYPQQTHRRRSGLSGAEFQGQPHDLRRPVDYGVRFAHEAARRGRQRSPRKKGSRAPRRHRGGRSRC